MTLSWQTGVKRGVDIIGAAVGLCCCAPLLGCIAAAIGLTMGRPVIFAQRRPGLNSKPFTMYKFRTMSLDRDSSGSLLPDTSRITRLGRFLRSTSLDELPELVNVWRGEMSLVGPRPLLMDYLPRYTPEQSRRHHVKPGITGWAQINGRNGLSWEEKFRLDVWYTDNWSLWLDLRILARTAVAVIRRDGINASANCTMPAFERSTPDSLVS